MTTPAPTASDIIADTLIEEHSPEPVENTAERILAALEAAGFIVLDECARCHEDPRAHWCADLEETFN